jgi:hypothetical protein
MTSPIIIEKQIKTITMNLINCSLCVDQNYPISKKHNSKTYIKFTNNAQGMLKNKAYCEIYDALVKSRSYNIQLLDGAIIQFMYEFDKDELKKHRLAFFSSPYLEEYQNNPEIYEEDDIYSDIIRKDTVPFPIRFDFDCEESVVKDIIHPASHLTLGQYQGCRIPASAPLTPYQFITFILRNFYNTTYSKYSESIKYFDEAFDETITRSEMNIVYIKV